MNLKEMMEESETELKVAKRRLYKAIFGGLVGVVGAIWLWNCAGHEVFFSIFLMMYGENIGRSITK